LCKLMPMSTVLPIYMYHYIRPFSDPFYESHLSLPPKVLGTQIRWFKSAGFAFLTLGQSWSRIVGGESHPKAVCLTFDDVDQEFMRNALPVLEEEKVPATLFVIAGTLSGVELFNVSERMKPLPPCRLRDMVEKGHEIGCHGMTHRELPGLPEADLQYELVDSRRLLMKVTGSAVDSFAYPRGGFDDGVMEAAKEAGYTCACTTLRGNTQDPTDRYRLHRIRLGKRHTGARLRYTTTPLYHQCKQRRRRRDRLRMAGREAEG